MNGCMLWQNNINLLSQDWNALSTNVIHGGTGMAVDRCKRFRKKTNLKLLLACFAACCSYYMSTLLYVL